MFIGVDPHKRSATIEVVDEHETELATGRFGTDKAGYAAMRTYVSTFGTLIGRAREAAACSISLWYTIRPMVRQWRNFT